MTHVSGHRPGVYFVCVHVVEYSGLRYEVHYVQSITQSCFSYSVSTIGNLIESSAISIPIIYDSKLYFAEVIDWTSSSTISRVNVDQNVIIIRDSFSI